MSSLTGNVTLQDNSDTQAGSLIAWYQSILLSSPNSSAGTFADFEPWLGLIEDENGILLFNTVTSIMPPTLRGHLLCRGHRHSRGLDAGAVPDWNHRPGGRRFGQRLSTQRARFG